MLMAAVLAAVFVSLCARPARADFEAYHLYGAGPVSSSLGGLSVSSVNDPLDYLVNPSYIKFVLSKRYTLAYGNYSASTEFNLNNQGNDYKYLILSYAAGEKAYSFVSDEQSGATRDMITYTAPVPGGKKYHVAANISAFRFSTPAASTQFKTFASDDGSGFTVDVGGFSLLENGAQAGLSIQNLLSTASEIETPLGDTKVSLPRIFNLSISYPLREWIDIYGGYKMYTVDRPGAEGSSSDGLLYIGAEYRFRGRNLSVRNGYQSDSEFTRDYDDQYGQLGISYVTTNYNAAIGSMTYNDSFDTPIALSVSYKPDTDAKWREPYVPEEKQADTGELVEKIEESVYEEKLPSTEAEVKKPPPPKKEPAPATPDEPDIEYSDSGTPRKTISEPLPPAKEKTVVADFKVEPAIIMVPRAPVTSFSDLEDHWARGFVESLAEKGYFPFAADDTFEPANDVSRAQFYSLVFISTISDRFVDPIMVYFKTPYAVKAELWLLSPELARPVLLQEGTYERSGAKRLVVNRDLLDDAGVGAGKYKLRLKLQHEDLLPIEVEDYITVLNTSMDFSKLTGKPPDKKMEQIESLKKNMSIIGVNADFLDRLMLEGPVTRLEAIHTLFKSRDMKLPDPRDVESLFSDIDALNTMEKAAVYLASRGMEPLDGKPLMGGYPGGQFKPTKTISRAEAAALVARFEKLGPGDFSPPFRDPYIPAREKPADQRKPDTLVSSVDGNQIDITTKIPRQEAAESEKEKPAEKTQEQKPDAKKTEPQTEYILAAGSYADSENADSALVALQELGYSPSLYIERIGSLKITHVVLGRFGSESEAEQAMSGLGAELPGFQHTMGVQQMPGGRTAEAEAAPSPAPARRRSETSARTGDPNASGEIIIQATPASVPEPLWNLQRNIDEFEPYNPGSYEIVE